MTSSGKQHPAEDFRARTARARRAATSVRLCAAALDVIDVRGATDLTVEAVHTTAGLSRGAFYRYFPSVDALLVHLADAIGAQLNAEMDERVGAVDDPALRIGLRFRYQVLRCLDDGACASVLARHVALHGSVSRLSDERVLRDFGEAVERGRFAGLPVRSAVDTAYGILAVALRDAGYGSARADRLEAATRFLLRGCGIESGEAAGLAAVSLETASTGDLRRLVLALCASE